MDSAATAVFLSYARTDRPQVEKLAAALKAAGYRLWWDDHLEGGAAFARTIAEQLDSAEVVVAVWSAASVASDWVRDEAASGRDRGVLVPVSLDGTLPPLGFRQYHCIDLSRWNGRATAAEFASLKRAIAAVSAAPPVSLPAATVIAPRRRPVPLLIAGAAAVALGLGGLWYATRAPSPPPAAAGAVAAVPPGSIAVLPFANMSGAAGDEYFSDGLSEQLRSTLASFSQLKVAARTSSQSFKGKDTDVRTIAARLGVAYVLEGSVRRSGAVVRVSAQLVETATGFERWSQSFDRKLDDVFAIQTEISNEVANALKTRLLAPASAHDQGATTDPAALDAYLRGRQQYDLAGDAETYRLALGFFDAAIAADPQFAAAHAARARTLIATANQFASGAEARPLLQAAVKSAERAVQIAPALADAQSTLGFTLYNSLDFPRAAAAYDRAAKLGSGDADLLIRHGVFKARMGDFGGAHAALARAAGLDPLNPRVPRSEAFVLYAERRYPDAAAAAAAALAVNPKMSGPHGVIGDAALMTGDLAKARAAYKDEPQALTRLTGLAIVEKRLGNAADAEAARAALAAQGGSNSLYQQAQIAAQWGDRAGALALLDRALAAGDNGLTLLRNDPLLDPLRADPRFRALLARLNFPEASAN